jgi:hypothetical protein
MVCPPLGSREGVLSKCYSLPSAPNAHLYIGLSLPVGMPMAEDRRHDAAREARAAEYDAAAARSPHVRVPGAD